MVFLLLFWLFLFKPTQPDLPPPPGTRKISDNFYIDKRAVTYLDYYEYLHYTKVNYPELLNQITPGDTTISYDNKILWNNPDFLQFPIVGLTMDQILLYCAWRSERVNEFISNPAHRCSDLKYWKSFDKPGVIHKIKVAYTLPSTVNTPEICGQLKKQALDEIILEGTCPNNKSKRDAFNKNNMRAFRCVAEYQLSHQ